MPPTRPAEGPEARRRARVRPEARSRCAARRARVPVRRDIGARADHRFRDSGEGRDLQSVALIRRALLDAVQEHELVAVLDGLDVHVGHAGRLGGEAGELEIMGREQREGADLWRRCSAAQAQASDRPSKVLVPRPTSSISTRLPAVALLRMFAVSVISSMKVERPPARSSDAPIRVKIRSSGPSTTRFAGTKQPMCARMTMSAVWRM